MNPRHRAAAIGLALLATLAMAAPALAGPDPVRVTESEAKAALRTFALNTDPAVIKPFNPWEGRRYCELDWHTILVFQLAGGDASFTKKDAAVILNGLTSFAFTLDGSALATERTMIRSVPDPERFGFVKAYFFNQGRVLSPAELPVGQHELSMGLGPRNDEPGVEDGWITFFIDAAGTGACLSQ